MACMQPHSQHLRIYATTDITSLVAKARLEFSILLPSQMLAVRNATQPTQRPIHGLQSASPPRRSNQHPHPILHPSDTPSLATAVSGYTSRSWAIGSQVGVSCWLRCASTSTDERKVQTERISFPCPAVGPRRFLAHLALSAHVAPASREPLSFSRPPPLPTPAPRTPTPFASPHSLNSRI